MKLKDWLKNHKECEYIRVYYTRKEGTWKRDSSGKPYIGKEVLNKRIEYTKNDKYLECDVVRTQDYESEASDPMSGYCEKIIIYCCWLDNDQVELVMKGKY